VPWTPDWLRLRLVEQELRSEWERLALDDDLIDADRSSASAEDGDALISDATRTGRRRD
jgi:hypothetical protein